MHGDQIIRAWKDEDYRAGLSAIERAALPSNPAGLIELPDELLDEPQGCEEGTLGPICKGISLVICDSWFPIGTFACCNALQ